MSAEAAQHVAGCEECSRVEREEQRLGGLLRSVGTVESPAGFEARVLSEIKSRRGERAAARFWFRPAVLVPAFAAVIVLAFIFGAYRQLGTGSSDSRKLPNEAVADGSDSGGKGQEIERPKESPKPSSEVADAATPSDGNEGSIEAPLRQKRGKRPSSSQEEGPGGGSLDQAVNQAQPGRPTFPGAPRQVDPEKATGPGAPLTPTKVFSLLGINADYGSSGWRVSSVRPRSIAANAGIKPGDIVRSLDGRVLTRAPLEGKSIEGKKLIVIRDGRQLGFELKPGN